MRPIESYSRKEIMPPNVPCVTTDVHRKIDRGVNKDKDTAAAIKLCNSCGQKTICAEQGKRMAAYIGVPQTVFGGREVIASAADIAFAQGQEPTFRFIPNNTQLEDTDTATYVRVLYRAEGVIPPALEANKQPLIPIIAQQIQYPPEEISPTEIERVTKIVAQFLNKEAALPLSQTVTTAKAILDDARILKQKGNKEEDDSIEMALRHPASYYAKIEKTTTVPAIKHKKRRVTKTLQDALKESTHTPPPQKPRVKEAQPPRRPERKVSITKENTQETFTPWRQHRNPLFTRSQEKRAFHHFNEGNTVNELFSDEQFTEQMKNEDLTRWFRLLRESRDIADVIISCNYGFITKVAREQVKQALAKDIPFDVLLTAGEMGLRKVLERYDPEFVSASGREVRFTTYAGSWCRRNIQAEIAEQNGLSFYKYQAINRALYISYAFEQALGRRASPEQLREQLIHNTDLTFPLIDFARIFFENKPPQSLDNTLSADSENTLHEIVAVTPEVDDEREVLYDSLDNLSPLQRTVIIDRFGINEGEIPLTSKQISQKLNKTVDEVELILNEAFTILRTNTELAIAGKERHAPYMETPQIKVERTTTPVVLTKQEEPVVIIEMSDLPLAQRIKMLYEQEKTNQEIADAVGKTIHQVASGLLKLRVAGEIKSRGEQTAQKIRELYEENKSAKEIAEASGYSIPHVRRIITQLGKSGEIVSVNKKRQRRDEQIKRLYEKGLTTDDIAINMDLETKTVGPIITRLIKNGQLISRAERERLERQKPPSPEVALVAEWIINNPPDNRFIPKDRKVE